MKRNPEVAPDVTDPSVAGHFQYRHVLYDDGISPGFLHLKHLPVGLFQFVVI